MLSISMADNVISYKNIQRNAQKVFSVAKIDRWNNSFQNAHDMLFAKVDRLGV